MSTAAANFIQYIYNTQVLDNLLYTEDAYDYVYWSIDNQILYAYK